MTKKKNRQQRKKENQQHQRMVCPDCGLRTWQASYKGPRPMAAWRCDCGTEWAELRDGEGPVYRIKIKATWRPMTNAEMQRLNDNGKGK